MNDELNITECRGPRFELAVEQAQRGASLTLDRVSVRLAENHVECAVSSQWNPSNLTDQRAWEDFEHAKRIFQRLNSESETFARMVEGKSIQYSIIFDYHTGCVELCRLTDGILNWADGVERPQ